MPDALWKAKERLVAKKVKGRRNPHHGADRADVESDFLALEVFMRKIVPEVELLRLDRARRIAGSTRLGSVVRTQPGTSRAIIMFDLDDFCDWFVSGPIKVAATCPPAG